MADLEPIVPPRLPAGIDTPAVVIDLDIVERNARRLGGALAARGIALRPHAKTHKSVALARLQLDAGARGLTVGNLGEAEVFAAAGLDDLFIAYPVWAAGPKSSRLRALHDLERLTLTIGFDSIEGAERLASAVSGSQRRLAVMLELDPGNRRTGAPADRAGEIAAAARDLGLEVRGVFTHGGHAYRPGGAEPAGADEVATLTQGAAALASEGIEPAVISAGSTPTQLTAATAPVNEIRSGTYFDRRPPAMGDRCRAQRRRRDRRCGNGRVQRRRRSGGHRRRRQDADQGRRGVPRPATASCPRTPTRSSSASPTTTALCEFRPAHQVHQLARSSP